VGPEPYLRLPDVILPEGLADSFCNLGDLPERGELDVQRFELRCVARIEHPDIADPGGRAIEFSARTIARRCPLSASQRTESLDEMVLDMAVAHVALDDGHACLNGVVPRRVQRCSPARLRLVGAIPWHIAPKILGHATPHEGVNP